MPASLPAPKSDFIGLEGRIHLATGGEPPLLVAHRAAFERFATDKADGMAGYARHWAMVDAVRHHLAGLVGLEAGDIALIGNASEGIVRVLSAIDWNAGDNVVVSERDYASGRYALSGLRRRGVEVRLVPARGWRIETDDLLAACDGRTRVLYVSQVNAMTGQLVPVEPLSQALAGSGTVLLVDASHALGAVPVRGDLADFTVSSCYKFALGIHEGIFAWNRRRRPDFEPFGVGWSAATPGATAADFVLKPDARRAEFGNAGHLGAYLLHESLAYLDRFGIAAIEAHVRRMCLRMLAGFAALGLEAMTPARPGEQAGNAAFVCADPADLVARAEADGILVWGDNRRIRASAHLFTTADDIEALLDRLPGYL